MKRIFIFCAIALVMSTMSASAFDLKGLLDKTKDSSNKENSTADKLGNLLGGLLSSSNIEVSDLVGEWTYDSPAVVFKSDNLLQKAGGAAASTAIENKIAGYYKTAGMEGMTLTVASDNTFKMKTKRGVTITGTISKKEDGNFIFNIKVGKKLPLGNVDTYITKSGSSIDVTFDVSKLITLVEKVASVAKVSELETVSKLLSSYDGLCAGFTFKK